MEMKSCIEVIIAYVLTVVEYQINSQIKNLFVTFVDIKMFWILVTKNRQKSSIIIKELRN